MGFRVVVYVRGHSVGIVNDYADTCGKTLKVSHRFLRKTLPKKVFILYKKVFIWAPHEQGKIVFFELFVFAKIFAKNVCPHSQ